MGPVLIAEDDQAVRKVLRRILEEAGYQVREAPNGRQAMMECCRYSFDLIITDIIMPGQEGIETIGALHRKFPKLKILAISGATGGEFLKVARSRGAQATIEKPLRMDTVLETVRNMLG